MTVTLLTTHAAASCSNVLSGGFDWIMQWY